MSLLGRLLPDLANNTRCFFLADKPTAADPESPVLYKAGMNGSTFKAG